RGDGIGHRHQWRMQRRRHRPHHVIADEHREHENRQPEDERIHYVWHRMHGAAARGRNDIELRENRESHHDWLLPWSPSPRGGEMIHAALFGLKFGCTTAPSRVSAVAFTMSSSQLIESALVFLSISTSRNASRFLAYRLDAVAASRPGTLL